MDNVNNKTAGQNNKNTNINKNVTKDENKQRPYVHNKSKKTANNKIRKNVASSFKILSKNTSDSKGDTKNDTYIKDSNTAPLANNINPQETQSYKNKFEDKNKQDKRRYDRSRYSRPKHDGPRGDRRKGKYSKERREKEKVYVYQKVIYTRKVTKTVKGGKNMSFYAVAIVGNKRGSVGVASGKSRTISDAIDKSISNAKKSVIFIRRICSFVYKRCATKVILNTKRNNIISASYIIAEIFIACGLYNVSCKSIGSGNKLNLLFTVFEALKHMVKTDKIKEIRSNVIKNGEVNIAE